MTDVVASSPAAELAAPRARRGFSPATAIAVVVLAVVVVCAIFGEWIAPYDPNEQDLLNSLMEPSRQHLLGTDDEFVETTQRVEASIAKLHSSEVLGRVVDAAVQIHGGYGVSKEFPLERWYHEARVRRIGEGPSEVHRMVIARQLFR